MKQANFFLCTMIVTGMIKQSHFYQRVKGKTTFSDCYLEYYFYIVFNKATLRNNNNKIALRITLRKNNT